MIGSKISSGNLNEYLISNIVLFRSMHFFLEFVGRAGRMGMKDSLTLGKGKNLPQIVVKYGFAMDQTMA